MINLVSGLFHLVVLGLLALISLINVDTGLPVRDVVVKLGVLLLLLAAAHGFTLTILMRMRDRRWQEQISNEIAEGHYNSTAEGHYNSGAQDPAAVRAVAEAEEMGRQTKSTERW